MPTVSICLPTHNRVKVLPEVLRAIREQTFTDYELIIGDDCSTDGTYQYLSSIDWQGLRIVRHPRNLNLFGNLTILFSLARGKYIAIHHDGDVCFPGALATLVNLLENNHAAGFACSACLVIEESGQERIYPLQPEMALFPKEGVMPGPDLIKILYTRIHTPIAPSLSLWRRDIVEEAGGYRPDWGLASDEDLYRRVARVSGVCFHPGPLFRMARRPSDRKAILGGWRGLYTIFEFRRDTALNFCEGGIARKQWLVFRLKLLKQVALWREALARWFWGDMEGMQNALRPELMPSLPSGRPPLCGAEKAILRGLFMILRWTRPLGRRIGNWRHEKG